MFRRKLWPNVAAGQKNFYQLNNKMITWNCHPLHHVYMMWFESYIYKYDWLNYRYCIHATSVLHHIIILHHTSLLFKYKVWYMNDHTKFFTNLQVTKSPLGFKLFWRRIPLTTILGVTWGLPNTWKSVPAKLHQSRPGRKKPLTESNEVIIMIKIGPVWCPTGGGKKNPKWEVTSSEQDCPISIPINQTLIHLFRWPNHIQVWHGWKNAMTLLKCDLFQ